MEGDRGNGKSVSLVAPEEIIGDGFKTGRIPQEVKEMEEDLGRLEEYVDQAVSEVRIRNRSKLRNEDVLTIVKMLVLNRSNKEIHEAINKSREAAGLSHVSKPELGVWRYRDRYKHVILGIRKMIFQKMPDIFENTNPVFIIYRLNILSNYLWQLGFEKGLKESRVDTDTQNLIKLYFRSIQEMQKIIKINVEEIQDTEEKAEKIDVLAVIKHLKKKFKIKVSEDKVIEDFLKDKYSKQLETGAHP